MDLREEFVHVVVGKMKRKDAIVLDWQKDVCSCLQESYKEDTRDQSTSLLIHRYYRGIE